MNTPGAKPRKVIPIAPVASQPSAKDGGGSLYEAQKKVYPRSISGFFARWRWAMVFITQAVFYGLPWLEWGQRQMVLFDLGARRFYMFGLVLYPQDFIYLTGLLIISALSLFLFTAVAGRLWCGFACPQTVYTEIFMWIEHKVEGERSARLRLDHGPWNFEKIWKKSLKQTLWVLISVWTGFTFVGYFVPIRQLGSELLALQGSWQMFWVAFYGFATYGNAGFLREQVCKYMCPYARFQSAMFDKDTLIITYDPGRGEPRGPRSRKADPKARPLGDCVDCDICVHVCPTGIDIREGLQYECIGCAACIDGCNQVMDRMGYPRGLIRYTTENALALQLDHRAIVRRVLRPRVLAYSAILFAITLAIFGHLALRTPLKADVMRDSALGREVEDGMVENSYRVQIINPTEQARRFRVTVGGIESVYVAGESEFEVGPAGVRMVPLTVRVKPGHGAPGSNQLSFRVEAIDDATVGVEARSTFFVPR